MMGILDQYKQALEEEKEQNYDFPSNTDLTEKDKEAYKVALKKMRSADFSKEEVEEAINNSKKNMSTLGERHDGGRNENTMRVEMVRIKDEELNEKGLLKSDEISDIRVIRAYCPKCGKELVAKSPSMYNPFTMEKVCIHECCGTKYNLDMTYPHIAFYDNDGKEIITYA